VSVKLRDRDHIGWNTSNIISRLDSLGYSLFVDPSIMDVMLLQREHPEILAGIWVGYGKGWLLSYRSCNGSVTMQDRAQVTIED